MNKRKRDDFEDDGRVIAPMNVDGMPWYDPRKVSVKKDPATGQEEEGEQFDYQSLSPEEKRIYRKETSRMIWGVLKYAFPIALVFIAVFAALILIMTLAWK